MPRAKGKILNGDGLPAPYEGIITNKNMNNPKPQATELMPKTNIKLACGSPRLMKPKVIPKIPRINDEIAHIQQPV